MKKKVDLVLDDEGQRRLQFLCAAYGLSPEQPRPARDIVRALIDKEFDDVLKRLEAEYERLHQTNGQGDTPRDHSDEAVAAGTGEGTPVQTTAAG